MKKIAFLILSLTLIMSCVEDKQTEPTYESTGIITSLDIGECSCCGEGWNISIDGVEAPKSFNELPSNSTIVLENASFPISVKLNWSVENGACSDYKIVIDEIKKR